MPHEYSDAQTAVTRIAFEESVRKLGVVQDATESLRNRGATIIGAATAIGGFVGGLALNKGPSGAEWALVVLGLLAYLCCLVLCLLTLRPITWDAGQDTATLADAYASTTSGEVYRELAKSYKAAFDSAEAKNSSLGRLLQVAVGAMGVELVLFSCLLGLTAMNQSPAPKPAVVVVPGHHRPHKP